jgi:hypothetical protein
LPTAVAWLCSDPASERTMKRLPHLRYPLLTAAVITGITLFLVWLFPLRFIFTFGWYLAIQIFILAYSLSTPKNIWLDLRLFLAAFLGSSLGSLLLWGTCNFVQKPVCFPNTLKVLIFSNYAILLFSVFFLWLFGGLPEIIYKLYVRLSHTVKEMIYKMKS